MQPTFRLLCCGPIIILVYVIIHFSIRYTMALPIPAQPINTSLRKNSSCRTTAVAGMSVYTHAAETLKKKKPSLSLPLGCTGKCPGPAPTIAAKRTATATKTDTPIEDAAVDSRLVTREEIDMKQPGTVKQALAYTPSVLLPAAPQRHMMWCRFVDFTTSSTVNTNQYLDGMKLQGDNFILKRPDPYFLERVELLHAWPNNICTVRQKPSGRCCEHGQQATDH